MVNKKLISVLVAAVIVGSIAGAALMINSGADDSGDPPEADYPSSVTITQNDGRKVTVATPVE